MKDKQAIAIILASLVVWYLWERSRTRQPIMSATWQPSQASTAGGATGIGTNPITLAFQNLASSLSRLLGSKQAGNAPGVPTRPASPGVPMLPGTVQEVIPPPPLSPVRTVPLPPATDPNQPWWMNVPDVMFSVPDRPVDFSENPEAILWTTDPSLLGFDPNAIPMPGGGYAYPSSYPTNTAAGNGSGRIAIVGLEG